MAQTSQSSEVRAGAAADDAGIGMPITRPALIVIASHVHDYWRDRHVVTAAGGSLASRERGRRSAC